MFSFFYLIKIKKITRCFNKKTKSFPFMIIAVSINSGYIIIFKFDIYKYISLGVSYYIYSI